MRRRTIEQQWYDVFADWTLSDQAAALKLLNVLHGQKQREAQRETRRQPELVPGAKDKEAPPLLAAAGHAEVPGGPGPEDQDR